MVRTLAHSAGLESSAQSWELTLVSWSRIEANICDNTYGNYSSKHDY